MVEEGRGVGRRTREGGGGGGGRGRGVEMDEKNMEEGGRI
jgi:hypothetical protein